MTLKSNIFSVKKTPFCYHFKPIHFSNRKLILSRPNVLISRPTISGTLHQISCDLLCTNLKAIVTAGLNNDR